MSETTLQGRCLCGSVQITLHEPKDHIEYCHCEMCRRWTGSNYAALEGKSFEISGDDHISIYQSSAWAERAFCSKCGSNLWYKFLPTGNRSFLAGLFDDATALGVGREIFVDEQADWARVPGEHPRLTGAEVIEEAKEQGFSFD